jgi:hypothetical protein
MQPVSETMPHPALLLAQNTKTILFSDSFKEIYDAINALHSLFAGITGIKAGDVTDEDIMLPQGKAVSPIKAAHCLLEFLRTSKFLRGIHKAITHLKQRSPETRVNILYAGCGPYATLLLPMTTMFRPTEIRISLMDINQTSLIAARRLFEELHLTEYISDYIIADATTYQIKAGERVDMMVSETMLNALRNEPMVAVMNNLMPQLADGGIFIPEQITVDAALFANEEEMKAMVTTGYQPKRIMLGNVYCIGTSCKKDEPVTLVLPSGFGKNRLLNLLTEIDVYADEKLNINESSLTTPYYLTAVEEEMNYKAVTFEYKQGSVPHFKHYLHQ